MPKAPTNSKCLTCPAVPIDQARQLPCWQETRCHRRRSHYRHRAQNNTQQRVGYRRKQAQTASVDPSEAPLTLIVPTRPPQPAAFLVLYQQTKESPVHAVAGEVWLGDRKVGHFQPQHVYGKKAKEFNQVLTDMSLVLKQQFGVSAFEREVIVLSPQACPLSPCPLHP